MQLFSSSADRNNRLSPRTITVRLHDLHDLFAMPRHNAFLENYLPLSGIDQIAQELKLMRSHEIVKVNFVLPQLTEPVGDQHAQVQSAIQRYCDNRLRSLIIDLKVWQVSVIRSLQIGVVILGVSLGLAAAISRTESIVSWLRTLLSNSISIFGSVALWSPADAFLFGMRPLYNEIRTYKAIRDIDFDIQYEKAGSNSTIADQPIFGRGRR